MPAWSSTRAALVFVIDRSLQNREREVSLGHEEAAFGDALGCDARQVLREVAQAAPSGNSIVEGLRDGGDLFTGLVREFQAETKDSGGHPLFQMTAGLLRFSAEHRVAAADVGHQRMRAACGVA